MHNLSHISGAKILLRSIAKAVSHMACFDRFLFLKVWPSLRIPFLKTAGTNQEQKLSGSKRNSWKLTCAFSYCMTLLMCNKFSMNVNFLSMTMQMKFYEGSILISSFSLPFIHFACLKHSANRMTVYNVGSPDLWFIILATFPCPHEIFKVCLFFFFPSLLFFIIFSKRFFYFNMTW